jgi:hypothetical protein
VKKIVFISKLCIHTRRIFILPLGGFGVSEFASPVNGKENIDGKLGVNHSLNVIFFSLRG